MTVRPIDGLVETWFVVFHRETTAWWVRLLASGRFRHVSAVGWSRAANCWVVVDPRLRATMVVALPDGAAAQAYFDTVWQQDRCTVVSMPGGQGGRARLLGGWCVPAAAQLVGLRSGALRPDALLKDCLRHGGRVIYEDAAAAGRSDPARGTAASGAGTGADGPGSARLGDGAGVPDVRGAYRPLGRLHLGAPKAGVIQHLHPLTVTECADDLFSAG
ncbi:hypothetical protein [Xanthobacter autotrophicus]|uniref:hypothetical protein n=1 Tax=Xanthobacter autotrophicus TaxID=280 RepID=UPI00372C2331